MRRDSRYAARCRARRPGRPRASHSGAGAKSSPGLMPPPGGRQIPPRSAACESARRSTGSRMNRVTSWSDPGVGGSGVLPLGDLAGPLEVDGIRIVAHRAARPSRAQSGHAPRAQAAASGAGARTARGDAARASARAYRERCADRRLRALREARLRRGRGHGHPAGARVRRGGRRPSRRRRPADPARLRSARAGPPAARATRHPHRVRASGLPARRGGGRAASPHRRAGRRSRRVLDRGLAARRDRRRDTRGARRPALGAAAALRARTPRRPRHCRRRWSRISSSTR